MSETTIGIKLALNGASETKAGLNALAADFDKVKDSAGKIKDAMGGLPAVLGALAGVASVGAFVSIVKGAVESSAALYDLSIQTGATVDSLRSLAGVGKFSDQSAESIATAMGKMAKAMAGVGEGGEGAGKAIEAIGLSSAKLKTLSPDEQMRAIANAMANFQDGSGKAAVAMTLFGKEGAKLLPFMKDLAAAGDLGKVAMKDYAEQADNLTDNMTRLKAGSQGYIKAVANEMIPVLDTLVQAYIDVTGGVAGWKDEIKKLAADGSIQEWASKFVTVLTYVADMLAVVWRDTKTMATGLGAYVAAAEATLQGNFSGAAEIIKGLGAELSDMWAEQTMGQQVRERIEAIGKAKTELIKSYADAAKDVLAAYSGYDTKIQQAAMKALKASYFGADREAVDYSSKDPKKSAAEKVDPQIKAYADLVANIHEKIAAQELEAEVGDKLLESDKLRLDILKLVEKGTISLTAAKRDELDALLGTMRGRELAKKSEDEHAKRLEELGKANKAAIDAATKDAASLADQVTKQNEANEAIGLTALEVAKLEAARLSEHAAAKDRLATLELEQTGNVTLADQYREQADALRDLAKAKVAGATKQAIVDEAKAVADEWKKTTEQIQNNITDALMRGFEKGKGFAANMRDTIVAMFKTLVLRPIISAVVNPVAGAIAGSLGLAGAANAATGAASGAAGAGLIGALGTGLGAGFSSIAGAGVGGWLSASGSLLASGSGAGALAGVGMLAGPIAALAGVVSLLSGLDHSGTYHTGGASTYSAATGAANIDAMSLGTAAVVDSTQGKSFTTGIVQSIVGILDSTAATFGKSAGYTAATAFADDSSKDGAWGALVISKGGKTLLDWAATQTDKWAPKTFADGEAGAKQYASAVAVSIRDLLIEQTPQWADDMLKALGDSPTLDQLGTVVAQINATQAALITMGDAAQTFASLGETASAALIKALGGAQAATASLASYYDNFFTDAERAAVTTKQVTGKLADMGINSLPANRAAYRKLIDDALSAGNEELAAKLIALSGAFASITDAASAASGAVSSVSQATKDLQSAALSALEKSVSREKSQWQTQADAAKTLQTEVQGVFETLGSAIKDLRSDAIGLQTSAAQGQQYIAQAVAAAQTTGALPDQAALSDAITAARGGLGMDSFASVADQKFAQLQLAGQLESLQGVAGVQLTTAEQMLATAESQLHRLDETIDYWKQQVELSQGGIDATLTVEQAVRDLIETLSHAKSDAKAKEDQKNSNLRAATPPGAEGYISSLDSVPDFMRNGYAKVGNRYVNIGDYSMASPEDYYAGRLAAAYWSPEADMKSTFEQLSSGLFAGSARDLLDAAKAAGLSQDIIDSYAKEFLPGYAVGTNYVPKDGPAYLHKGEMVVPAAYNPAVHGVSQQPDPAMRAEMAAQREELAAVRSLMADMVRNTRRTADALNGNPEIPMLVTIA